MYKQKEYHFFFFFFLLWCRLFSPESTREMPVTFPFIKPIICMHIIKGYKFQVGHVPTLQPLQSHSQMYKHGFFFKIINKRFSYYPINNRIKNYGSFLSSCAFSIFDLNVKNFSIVAALNNYFQQIKKDVERNNRG